MLTKEEKKLFNQIDNKKEEVFNFLKNLVRTPSVTGNELSAQLIVERKFLEMGLKVKRVNPKYDAIVKSPEYKENRYAKILKDKNRFNVIGQLNQEYKAKLLLFAHIDTWPATKNNWIAKPFEGKIIGKKMYGRGAADDKFGITILTMALKIILDLNLSLKKNIILASTIGEEFGIGGLGYEGLFSCLASGFRSDLAISPHGKPFNSNPLLTVGCSGYLFFSEKNETIVLTKRQEINKHRLTIIRLQIQKYQIKKLKYSEPAIVPAESHRILTFPTDKKWWQLNLLPFENRDKVSLLLKRYFPKTEIIPIMKPSLTDYNNSLINVLASALKEIYNKEPDFSIQNSGSDMRFANEAGIPTVSFGPISGNSHNANEWVDLSDLLNSLKAIILCILRI